MRIKITGDLYDIAWRLKEIDTRYEVFFDTNKQKFVLTANGEYQLTFPFDDLDQRAIEHVYSTRIERMDEILKEMEESNRKSEQLTVKKVKDEIENEYSRRLRLSR